MKRSLIMISLISLLGGTAIAQTQTNDQEEVKTTIYDGLDDFDDLDEELDQALGSDFQVSVDGEINTSAMSGSDSGNNGNFSNSYISLSATYKNKIRAVLTAKLEQIFKENDVSLTDDFKLGEFIKEAFIEIKEVNGSPIAIIVGKQPIAFAQNVQAMPIFKNNPLSDLQEIDEVFGLTVELTEGLFGLFDQAEFSAFETKDGDLEIGRIDGASIRLSKTLTNNFLLTLSHAEVGNSHLSTGAERRTSVGLIGESNDGMLVGWVEGMYFSNNPTYASSSFAITIGAMVSISQTTDIVIEYSWVEKEVQQIGLGAKVALTRDLTLGAEVRYNNYVNKENDVTFGLNLTYTFGTSGHSKNEASIFSKSDENGILD